MRNIVLSLLVCLSSFSFGQTAKTLYHSEKDVNIYLEFRDCNNSSSGVSKQYLFIDIENNSAIDVIVSFDKEYWYDNVCQTCNSNSREYETKITVPAKSRLNGACDSKNKLLKIFSKMLNISGVRQLTKYELKNIHIESTK
ncbi:MAG: hypothetical protein HRT73_08740 [Flavobacteriales bacterium]|nr:hypothetical protein [Flavobacteriales bacterium]NQX97951.1 hypothetical protein [Flavobacteriales bacterium]